jgi:hypothetical protein
MSIVQSSVSLISVTAIITMRMLKFRARLSYEPTSGEIERDPENPYRPTVEDATSSQRNDETEGAPEHSRMDASDNHPLLPDDDKSQ